MLLHQSQALNEQILKMSSGETISELVSRL
jgi:hypothetical protein